MTRIEARELEQKAEFNNPIKEVMWRELTRVDPKKKEVVLRVLSHFGGDSKAIDMVLILHGDGISYPGVFLNKPIEFFEELDKKLLKRNPHRHNMLNPEFVKFEKHRVDFFVDKLRREMEWEADYIFSDEVVFEGFTRVFDSKYFKCEYKINYDEKLGYSIKELMKHYEDLEMELEEMRRNKEYTQFHEEYMRDVGIWMIAATRLGCDYVRRKDNRQA